MRSWFNFKTAQRINAVLKVVVKSVFISMTQTDFLRKVRSLSPTELLIL